MTSTSQPHSQTPLGTPLTNPTQNPTRKPHSRIPLRGPHSATREMKGIMRGKGNGQWQGKGHGQGQGYGQHGQGGRKTIFDDEEDEGKDMGAGGGLSINKKYAQDFERIKKGQELEHLKQMVANKQLFDEDEDEEEYSSEDEGNNDEWEEEYLDVLARINQSDPSLKTEKEPLFKPKAAKTKEDKGKQKSVYLQDYVRNTLLEHGPELLDSDDEFSKGDLPPAQEQEMTKKEFLKAAEQQEQEEDDDEFLTLRKKSKKEKEQDELDMERARREHNTKKREAEANFSKTMMQFWNATDIDENEKFLRSYVLNQKWRHNGYEELPTYEEIVDPEEDEMEDKLDDFERKYNFRFEEEKGTQYQSHPRKTEDSVRRDTGTKKIREKERKERKAEEKIRREEDLKRLKNLKKQEIMEKLKQIENITGTPALNPEDLEADFDPIAHDAQMQAVFDEEFYSKEDMEKPVFPDDDDEELPVDEEDIASVAVKSAQVKSRNAWKVARNNSKDNRDNLNLGSFLEEYYKLDYEDLIDGTIPCRFQYIKVPKSTFGIPLEKIIETPDKDLKQMVSMKKLAPYRIIEKKKRSRWAKNKEEDDVGEPVPKKARRETTEADAPKQKKKKKQSEANEDSPPKKAKKEKTAEEDAPKKKKKEKAEEEDAPKKKKKKSSMEEDSPVKKKKKQKEQEVEPPKKAKKKKSSMDEDDSSPKKKKKKAKKE